jgi:hypothetical protein
MRSKGLVPDGAEGTAAAARDTLDHVLGRRTETTIAAQAASIRPFEARNVVGAAIERIVDSG